MAVGTGGTTPAARAQRGASNRPRWWGVLAVSLALMALVAALSAPSRQGRDTRAGVRRPSSSISPPRRTRERAPTGPGGAPTTVVGSPTTVPANAALGPASVVAASGGAGPATTAPATTATTAPLSALAPPGPVTTTTSTTVPAPAGTTTVPAVTVDAQPGNLEYPDNISAQYPVDSGGGASAVADFSGAAVLGLSVTCPGGQVQRDGASGVSVSVGGPAGTCTVDISETTPQAAPVSYTLTVQYPRS